MFRKRGDNRDGSAGSIQNFHEDSPVSSGIPKNNSENCLTIQVPLYETTDSRKSHSSPSRHPLRPRRYSQGAVLVGPHFSVLSGELVNTSASPSPWSCDVDLLRHSSENLRDITSDSAFPSTAHLLDQDSLTSGSVSSDGRKKVSRTPHERLNKLAKRHWPDDHLIPLDDICESPLVKTPNEPAQWSAEHRESHQLSTTATLFALDSVTASLHLDKG